MRKFIIFIILSFIIVSCSKDKSVVPPKPLNPIPSNRQLTWHEMEYYAFIHFSINTFTNLEWGYGDENPELFNPTELDCEQWARVCKEAGMKGIILTAKHHDGFCLWPSAYTKHSVKNSLWKDGQGDVLQELREACDKYDLKLGFYLSPWDRNHAEYGNPEYIVYFRNQLKEILKNYGDLFEIWFDGANGGDGYYGGARESRKIDKKTYYDWKNTYKFIRELQPNAVIFTGGDVRWIGNEKGIAGKTNWCTFNFEKFVNGEEIIELNQHGEENGTHWMPGEADVSIRPGWFYHKSQDNKVKTLDHLIDLYYKSIGRNASLLLNLPVDRRGLIHENDIEQLKKLKHHIDISFQNNLAASKNVKASNVRGNSKLYEGKNVTDGNKDTYWATDDKILAATLTIDFKHPVKFNRLLIQEYIKLGQRIKSFSIDIYKNGDWQEIAKATTIGYKRILRFPMVESDKVRINFNNSKACPVISNIEIYKAPDLKLDL